MKKLLLLAMSTVLLAGFTIAQQQQAEDKTKQNTIPKDEHFVMKDGKMFHVMDGKEMSMQQAMTLKNGMMVHTDGSYILKNGRQKDLQNGQCMDMKGNVYRSQHMLYRKMMRQHNMMGMRHAMHRQGNNGGMMGKHGSHH